MRRLALLITVLLIITLTFTACGDMLLGVGTEDLLQAPQLSSSQRDVLKALTDYLGESIQLKYPRHGSFLSPLLFWDLNGDGVEEVIVLYTSTSLGKNVNIALMENEEGKWKFTFGTEGINTDVERVEFTQLHRDGSTQVIIGYTSLNLSDKYLEVYNYRDSTLQKQYEQAYSDYGLADFTGDGKNDLVVVSLNSQPGPVQITLLSSNGQAFEQPVVTSLDNRFTSCSQFAISSYRNGKSWIVLDGYIGAFLASEVLEYNGKLFVKYGLGTDVNVPTLSLRSQTDLTIRDIDNNGITEVPVVTEEIESIIDTERMYWVSWYDYVINQNRPTQSGIVDTYYGYFLRLPDSWKGKVSIEPTPDVHEWLIRDIQTGSVLLFVRILAQGEELTSNRTYTQAATIGNYRIFLAPTEKTTAAEKRTLIGGITILI
ncbi:MAG: hypothetical protein PHG02_06555 [Oscillospiraceae bacterium]|nr:hypothetical protein [Oscillospiraceae bacterium]